MNDMSYEQALDRIGDLSERLSESEQRIAELEHDRARRDKLLKAAVYEEVRDSWSGALTKVADRLRREAEESNQ